MRTAVVTGMIATYPVGGVAWDYGQYALGLERLGFETYYLEDTGWETYDPRVGAYGADPAYGVAFLREALGALSPTLGARWHVRAMDGTSHGVEAAAFREIVAGADVLVNVSGGTLLRDEWAACRRTLLLDTDPGWNHFVNYPKWDANPGWQGSRGWRAHDRFFTYAENIGEPGCALPTLGIEWWPTRPPVVLDRWSGDGPGDAWTTVMTWDNFRRPVEHEGRTYGTKEMEFGKIEPLPTRLPDARFELAVGGASAPVDRWRSIGWSVVASEGVSRTASDYRRYVERSRGELSVAKNLYVATGSGWFSCRSVCYLAAGRPVVVQDTGFSERIPGGEGLFAFRDLEGAVAGVAEVERDYERHRAGARAAARRHFDSDVVLGAMLERAGVR